jgi:peroxiredoxin
MVRPTFAVRTRAAARLFTALFAPLFALSATFAAGIAQASALPGETAPAFRLGDIDGKQVSLADYKGKYVVLEWTNPSCPFVMKHYNSGNMQALQKRFTGEGVAWLAVNSTVSAHSEHLTPAKQGAWFKQMNAAPTTGLLDNDGATGRAYGAKTTPQMVIIDPAGVVRYNGAIDDKRSTDVADVKTAQNYVTRAFAEIRAGKPVSLASTAPYGCSVKYQ